MAGVLPYGWTMAAATQVTTVSSKGQVVIPAGVRRKLGIRRGALMKVEVNDDAVVLTPIREDLGSLRGIISGVSLTRMLAEERARDKEREG